jgi:hypothetical protein
MAIDKLGDRWPPVSSRPLVHMGIYPICSLDAGGSYSPPSTGRKQLQRQQSGPDVAQPYQERVP